MLCKFENTEVNTNNHTGTGFCTADFLEPLIHGYEIMSLRGDSFPKHI